MGVGLAGNGVGLVGNGVGLAGTGIGLGGNEGRTCGSDWGGRIGV